MLFDIEAHEVLGDSYRSAVVFAQIAQARLELRIRGDVEVADEHLTRIGRRAHLTPHARFRVQRSNHARRVFGAAEMHHEHIDAFCQFGERRVRVLFVLERPRDGQSENEGSSQSRAKLARWARDGANAAQDRIVRRSLELRSVLRGNLTAIPRIRGAKRRVVGQKTQIGVR